MMEACGIAVALCAAVAAGPGLVGCAASPTSFTQPGVLPARLHGLPRAETRSGEHARREIGSLHGRTAAPVEALIVVYGPPAEQAVVYASLFRSTREAWEQLDAMARRIGAGSSGFGDHTRFRVGEIDVHSVRGHGQVHCFFVRGRDVVWLAAPPLHLRQMLAELLAVDVTQVPRLEAASQDTAR
jgi:hypothetical protein